MNPRIFFSALALSGSFLTAHAQTCGLRDNGATMTDPVTGIEIRKCAVGQTWSGNSCTGSARHFSFAGALKEYAQGEWRLISKEEADRVISNSKNCHAISFDSPSWTSTPGGRNAGDDDARNWYVNFSGGFVKSHDGRGVASGNVRLVRASQLSGGAAALGSGAQRNNGQNNTNNPSENQNQTGNTPEQQMTQRATAQARETQAKGDADAKKQGRRRHDPAMEAHECISIDTSKPGFGVFRNSCNFKVTLSFCNQGPKKDSWAGFHDCAQNHGGAVSVRAGGEAAAHIKNTEYVHWFACKDPAWALDTAFDGTNMTGRCRVVFGD